MRKANRLWLIICLCALLAPESAPGQEPALALPKKVPVRFECRWAFGKMTIDGKADEAAWKDAQAIDTFYLPWLGDKARKARTATKAKLLWDRDYVYFFAEMEDTDLYADVKEHDGRTWDNDVFELFFKPAQDKPGYYEFQVTPANTTMDVFMPRRGAGGFGRFKNAFPFEFDTKVQLRGTLNRWQDKDKGWSVEGRISWKSFIQTGGRPQVGESWKFALCRYDYSVDFEGPELSTCAPLKSKRIPDFHLYEDYATLKFVGAGQTKSSSAAASARGKLPPLTTSKVLGSPDPPKPYRVVRAYPKVKVDWPICVRHLPGTDQLLVINEARSYAPSRLLRMEDNQNVSKHATLMDFDGVAYDLTFHPRFMENGYLYVGHHLPKHKNGPHCRVTRYVMQSRPPYRFDAKSARTIIEWPSNGHNGAAVVFGTDGMLYVTTGDGTVRRDTDVVGQRLDLLKSKVLRIDVDNPANGMTYSIPKDNPFVDFPGARPETWCYGFRNPWRIAVDRETGHVWVGNNGQDSWEQIYLIQKGANYGWSVYEGGHLFIAERKPGPTPISKPTFDHPHSEARSLTGGIVYYGKNRPELRGAYLYGDYSTGKIWAAKHDGKKVLWHKEIADTSLAISCFETNKDGEILVADHRGSGKGGFYRLELRPKDETTAKFPNELSDTGLFAAVAKHELMPGVLPYSVNAPGWHDGARAQRYLAIPSNTTKLSINLDAKRGWALPDHTVLVQTLSLETEDGNPQSLRRIETRMLTKQDGEWLGYSYLWNDTETDAKLVGSNGTKLKLKVKTRDGLRQRSWHVPSRSECMACHSRAAEYVLGMTTLQFNHRRDLEVLRTNQLDRLEDQGYFTIDWLKQARNDWRDKLRADLVHELRNKKVEPKAFEKLLGERLQDVVGTRGQRIAPQSSLLARPPEKYPSLPNPFDKGESLDRRARSYLHANCAHCHVPDGGGNARIVVEWGTDLDKMNLVNVAPMHGSFGLSDGKLIVPGSPEKSVLVYRLASLGSGRMPRVGSHEIDERGLALIRAWIRGMAKVKPNAIVAQLANLPDKERAKALAEALASTSNALALLQAMDEKRVPNELAAHVIKVAASHPQSTVRDLFERFVPEEKRVQRLGVNVNPETILSLGGNVARGRQLFFSSSLTCANCHQINGQGKLLGPDLSTIGKKHKPAQLLENVLEPSRVIEKEYATYVVQTKRGRILTGLLLKQTKSELVIKDAEHKETRLDPAKVERITQQTKSLMPDLLLKDITAEDAADLIAFLASLK